MKILWLCNVIIPVVAKQIGAKPSFGGGWIQGAATAVAQETDIQLYICFPQMQLPHIIKGEVNGIYFFGFPASEKPEHIYDSQIEVYLKEILEQVSPDIVHIWGTEFSHSLAMTKAFSDRSKILLSVQGLCSFIAKHYTANLSEKVCKTYTIRDFLRKDRIIDQQKKFYLRGIIEAQTIQNAGYIIGRTSWDQACVRQLSPKAEYRVCNETLRNIFYEKAGTWSPDSCEKHSIFVSQSNYPLKGFHMVFQAMPQILRRYPDTNLYTTGRDPFSVPFYRINGYQMWLRKQIIKLGIRNRVHFLGNLDDAAMSCRFLKSNVFVSASSIENSPNSVGEAMLLGVPTVASYVGGTMDMLRDGVDGYLYPFDASYILTDRVCKIFSDDALAVRMGMQACKHALITHDPETNLKCLLNIYKEAAEK